MHLKKLSKVVAMTVVLTMVTPAVVMADDAAVIKTDNSDSKGQASQSLDSADTAKPDTSVIPDNTIKPDTPVNPDNPTNPDTPVNPDDPSNPDTPVNPDDPANPDTPVNPDDPTNPDTPVNPDDPTNPDTPVNPDDPTNPDTPVNPDDPENPDTPVNPDDPANPDTPVNPDDPSNPDTPVNPDNPADPAKPDDEKKEEEKKDTESPDSNTTENTGYSSWTGGQHSFVMPDIKEDFRFRTIRKVYAFALEDLNIYEEKSESSRPVGTLEKDGVCYLLSNDGLKLHMDDSEDIDTDDGTWVYVESGTVRGFVLKAKLLTGDEAQAIADAKAKEKQEAAEAEAQRQQEAEESGEEQQGVEEEVDSEGAESQEEQDPEVLKVLEKLEEANARIEMNLETNPDSYVPETEEGQENNFAAAGETESEENQIKKVEEFKEAKELVAPLENGALLYTKTTVRATVVDKDYAVCTALVSSIYEGQSENSRVIGNLNKDNICYILADKDKDWIYVESGDVRGFIKKSSISMNEEALKIVEEKGEDNLGTASELIKPDENKACYYTITSVKGGVPGGALRQSILEFASQFVGNPYVWGGTSLTSGADCSGFVQSIYAQYGYSLPRVAQDQAYYGTQIAVEDAMPGDLIFYARGNDIYHVVMYAGDGKTVEAANSRAGIIVGNVNTANAVWATRVIDDTYGFYGSDIDEQNASPSQYGDNLGSFRITHYCGGSCCNDQWAGVTSTGAPMVEGDTIAVDPTVIPYGTKVIINGHIFTASDCGGAIKGNRIDVFVNDHNRGNNLGVYYTNVYLVK